MAYTARPLQKEVPFLGFTYVKGYGFNYLKRMKGLGNLSLRSVEGPERANRRTYGSEKDKKLPGLVIYSYLKRRCI